MLTGCSVATGAALIASGARQRQSCVSAVTYISFSRLRRPGFTSSDSSGASFLFRSSSRLVSPVPSRVVAVELRSGGYSRSAAKEKKKMKKKKKKKKKRSVTVARILNYTNSYVGRIIARTIYAPR